MKTEKPILTEEQIIFLGWILGIPGIFTIASIVFLGQFKETGNLLFFYLGIIWIIVDILAIFNSITMVFSKKKIWELTQ